MAWAFQDAKAQLSEVFRRAEADGPQEVTVRGESKAYIVSKTEFEAMRRERALPPRQTIIEFLLEGDPWPDDFAEMVNQRSKEPAREVDL